MLSETSQKQNGDYWYNRIAECEIYFIERGKAHCKKYAWSVKTRDSDAESEKERGFVGSVRLAAVEW